MNAKSIRIEDPLATLHAQRECFTPSNLELAAYLHPAYGKRLDAFAPDELAIAKLVFAQVALMAGAALAADSETFVGAERLWSEMQHRIGPQERSLAKRLLEVLSHDDYYSESEQRLICALARSISLMDERRAETSALAEAKAAPPAARPQPPLAKSPIALDDALIARLRTQRDACAPSKRELSLLFQAEFGRGPDAFGADEVAVARTVFSQVVLMLGAALSADSETYLGAERLWYDMQHTIDSSERVFARRLLDLLSRDAHYTEGERRLIASLATGLPEADAPRAAEILRN